MQVGEIAEALAPRVETLERVQGGRVGLVDVDDGAVGRDRGLVVGELLFLDLRDSRGALHALLGLGAVLEGVAVERDALGRLRALGEQAIDRLEGGLLLLGREGVCAAIELQRARRLLLRLEQLTGAVREARGARLVRS